MEDLQAIISILNFLGLGGLGAFLYFLVKGLKERIISLTALANEQKMTLETVRDRAEEAGRLSQSYKD